MQQLGDWRDVARSSADGPLVYAFDGDVLVYGEGFTYVLESYPPQYGSQMLGNVRELLKDAGLAPADRKVLERVRDDLSLIDRRTGEFAPNTRDPLIRRVEQEGEIGQ